MDETRFIWLNGSLVPWHECKVHFLTHSLHYGSSIFEGIRCYDGVKGPAVFRLKEHLKRFSYSASVFGMKLPFTEKELFDAVIETIKANEVKECYVRPLAFYGYGQMGLNPVGARVDAGIAVWPWGPYLGREAVEKGVGLKVSPWVRPPRDIMPTNAKVAGNYVNSIMAKVDALTTGFTDAILLDVNGNIAEATGENVFMVKDGCLITPPLDYALAGITRDSIMVIAKKLGIKVEEKSFNEKELLSADECFLTGTAAEITPVVKVNESLIGNGIPGPLTKKLQEKFFDAAKGKDADYIEWLSFVK